MHSWMSKIYALQLTVLKHLTTWVRKKTSSVSLKISTGFPTAFFYIHQSDNMFRYNFLSKTHLIYENEFDSGDFEVSSFFTLINSRSRYNKNHTSRLDCSIQMNVIKVFVTKRGDQSYRTLFWDHETGFRLLFAYPQPCKCHPLVHW